MEYGMLYGIGVGPGDPELLTLKAVRVLGEVGRVFAAQSSKNTYSVSHEIVTPHLSDGVSLETLPFPMTRDESVLEQAWKDNARRVHEYLQTGKSAAFLTLGDPLTYSTFGYLWRTLATIAPDVPVEIVPGITSYNAAAAASGTILSEGEESLAIVSGAKGGDNIRSVAKTVDNIAILKAYRNYDDILEALQEEGLLEHSVLVSNCGRSRERILDSMSSDGPAPQYFSLVLTKRGGRRVG